MLPRHKPAIVVLYCMVHQSELCDTSCTINHWQTIH